MFRWRPVRFIRKFVSNWCVNLAARLDFFLLPYLEWLKIRDSQLIARLDRLGLAGVELLQEMNVAVEFFCDCIGGVDIQQRF